jgi:hypothetical protein
MRVWQVRRVTVMTLTAGAPASLWRLAFGLLFSVVAVAASTGGVAYAETAGTADGGAPPQPRSLLSLPAPRQPPPDEYRLRRATDGSGDLIYEASGFYANVARDGAVRFRDRHVTNFRILPFLPITGPRYGVPSLEDVVRRLGGRRRGGPNAPPDAPASDPIANETLSPSTTFSRFRPDPREICRYPSPCFAEAPVTLITVTGTLDLTDELMRLAHEDPYRFQKARFLTATRELRIRMAGRAHAEDVARSRAELPRRLEEIACDQGLSVADRRAIIEALRAELDVATPEGRAQSERIRRFLESWGPADGGVPSCPGH